MFPFDDVIMSRSYGTDNNYMTEIVNVIVDAYSNLNFSMSLRWGPGRPFVFYFMYYWQMISFDMCSLYSAKIGFIFDVGSLDT